MSGLVRAQVYDSTSIARQARAGDGFLNYLTINTIATDANAVLAAASLVGGVVVYSSFTAGRTITTDTAVNILALFPNMDVGDSIEVRVVSLAAFAITWAAGTGVTLGGFATTAASGRSSVLITKTSATTLTWNVL